MTAAGGSRGDGSADAMRPRHDPRHEDWLVARLAGESLPEDAAEAIAQCEECRRAIDEVGGLQAVLDAAGRLEREGMATAFDTVRPADTRREIAPDLHRDDPPTLPRSEPVRQPAPPPAVRPFATLAKVAAVLVVVVLLRSAWQHFGGEQPSRDPDTDGPSMGTDAVTDLSPSGTIERGVGGGPPVTEFRWKARLPSGGSFVVRVYDAPEGDGILFESLPLTDGSVRWTPDPAQLASLPNRFRWEVRVFDSTGGDMGRKSTVVTNGPE